MTSTEPPYLVRRASRSHFLPVRGLRYHARIWGDESLASPARPTLVMLHGWMDVAASFQFVVDAFAEDRHVIAIDWRGFGLTEAPPVDTYWLPDYLGDLDAVLDALRPDGPVDLLGHSMGGNAAMLYAGIRPSRIRRLVNLEGFGLPTTRPEQAPQRYATWLDELKAPSVLRRYDSLGAVADRLQKTNPLLPRPRAEWLAAHWSRRVKGTDTLGTSPPGSNPPGSPAPQWELLADAAHRRTHPILYQVPEVLACWRQITAPVLWVEGDRTDISRWWGTRYTKAELHQRLAVVPDVAKHLLSPAGHMLHHDQPKALAHRLEAFLA